MTPEPFTESNVLLKAPADWNEENMGPCHDMAVFMGNGLVVSTWRPNAEEIALLVGGGVVLLTIVTNAPPATQVQVIHTRGADHGMERQ